MTKLFNRRYFMQVSESLLKLSQRNNTYATMMMLDIDKFKNINDLYGHEIGDEVIISLAALLQNKSRKSDLICRWGGEEFVILLPESSLENAIVQAENIREATQELRIQIKEKQEIHFTVSIGLSIVNNSSYKDIDTSINRADIALYRAKNSGRNKVCFN